MSTSSTPPTDIAALQAASTAAWDKVNQARDAAKLGPPGDTALQAAITDALTLANQAKATVAAARAAAGTGNPAAPNPAAGPNPPNASNPGAAQQYKPRESESDTLKRNLEAIKTDRINIGVDDDTHSKVKVQKLVVLAHAAKATSQPDRIHDFIANILDRSNASTKITNGMIYYLTKEDYAIIKKAFPDISSHNALIRAPIGQNIISLTYESILDAYNNKTIDAVDRKSIILSGSTTSSTSSSTTPLTPAVPNPAAAAPVASTKLDPSIVDDAKQIKTDLDKINAEFVAIVITDFQLNVIDGEKSTYNTAIAEYTKKYREYVTRIGEYDTNTIAIDDNSKYQSIQTAFAVFKDTEKALNDFLLFLNFKRDYVDKYNDILQKSETKNKKLLILLNRQYTFTNYPKKKDVETKINELKTILFTDLKKKVEGLTTKKNYNISNGNIITILEGDQTPGNKRYTKLYEFFELNDIKSLFVSVFKNYTEERPLAPLTPFAPFAPPAPPVQRDIISITNSFSYDNVPTTMKDVFNMIYKIMDMYIIMDADVKEELMFSFIKQKYEKNIKYINILELDPTFKNKFKEINSFIKKTHDIYKTLFIIIQIFKKYLDNDAGKIDNILLDLETDTSSRTNKFIKYVTFLEQCNNKVMFKINTKTEEPAYTKDIKDEAELKASIKPFFENIKKNMISLHQETELLKTYFDGLQTEYNTDSNIFNNKYTITKWNDDKKKIENVITPNNTEIIKLNGDITTIFDTTLNEKHKVVHDSLEAFIKLSIDNATLIENNPEITPSTPPPKGASSAPGGPGGPHPKAPKSPKGAPKSSASP
jgi:hypothetical protein